MLKRFPRLRAAVLAFLLALPPSLAFGAGAINDYYAALPRPAMGAEELMQARYDAQFARTRAARHLLAKATAEAAGGVLSPARYADLLQSLDELNLRLRPEQIEGLRALHPGALDRRGAACAANLVSHQGDPSLDLRGTVAQEILRSGPSRILPIPPLDPSRWTFARWSSLAGQDWYDERGGAVHFRGLELRPGDVIMMDAASPMAAPLGSMLTPHLPASHLGVFFLAPTAAGGTVPAVMEITARGLRSVPLNTYFSPWFSTYVEVFRHRAMTENERRRLPGVFTSLSARQFTYDLMASGKPDHVVCTDLANMVFAAVGLPVVAPASRLRPGIIGTLEPLSAQPVEPVLAPTDYMRSALLEHVGVLDNNRLSRDLSYELLSHALTPTWEQKRLSIEALPPKFEQRRKRMAIALSGSLLGRILLRLSGFGPDERLPLVTAPQLAFLATVTGAMARAADALEPVVAQRLEAVDTVDVATLAADPVVAPLLQKSIQEIQQWYR